MRVLWLLLVVVAPAFSANQVIENSTEAASDRAYYDQKLGPTESMNYVLSKTPEELCNASRGKRKTPVWKAYGSLESCISQKKDQQTALKKIRDERIDAQSALARKKPVDAAQAKEEAEIQREQRDRLEKEEQRITEILNAAPAKTP